ncbi:MAG: BolA family transcriptional regulator [Deltaproteobacteria bacterium]|nr:BolA family transcriptional regulator [Deltaproteobacteria bacterium]
MTMVEEIVSSIEKNIEGSKARAQQNSGGHFEVEVTSAEFEGKNLLAKQRLVLNSIKHLMKGADAPVHAIDKITTLLPE